MSVRSNEGTTIIIADSVHDEVIDGFSREKHLNVVFLEYLKVGRALARLCWDPTDNISTLLRCAAGNILVEARSLSSVVRSAKPSSLAISAECCASVATPSFKNEEYSA